MSYQNKSKDELVKEILILQLENKSLQAEKTEANDKIRAAEERLSNQLGRFISLRHYTIKLSDYDNDNLPVFIVNSFKEFFGVKEVWMATYYNESSELVMEASTLSEEYNNKIVKKIGFEMIGSRVPVDKNVYDKMVGWGIGEPCSLHEVSFGQVPRLVSTFIEKIFGFGWFQGIALINKGKLYGGLVVAGHVGQKTMQKEELFAFTEVTSNVLKRRLAEKMLIESENRFHQLSDLLPESVFEIDADANFTFINQFGLNLLGYTNEDLRNGLNLYSMIPPETLNVVMTKAKEVLGGLPTIARDYIGKRKNGEEIHFLIHASRIEKEGKPVGLRGVGIDITDRLKTEELLSRERNLLRTLINNLPDRIYAKDTESRFIVCNKAVAEQAGKTSVDEILGKTDFDLFPLKAAKAFFDIEQNTVLSGQPLYDLEECMEDPPGTVKWTLSAKVPFHDKMGKIIGLVGIGKDITSIKQAEIDIKLKNEQLQKTNDEKDKFFSIISHDLRSPFNGFLGLTEILSKDIDRLTIAEIQDITEKLRTSAKNIYSLLDNLLEWSRIQMGRIEFKPNRYKLLQGITSCMEPIADYARKKEIMINIDVPENLEITVDNHMFETIIRNLVSNAIKFTRRGGVISISSSLSRDFTEIRVSDSGIGIPEDMINKLFKLGEKVSRKGTDNEPSSGLGLLLCKEFVEKHGGEIMVESEKEKGSTFRFTIPMTANN